VLRDAPAFATPTLAILVSVIVLLLVGVVFVLTQ
jgi:hypothetical protein